MVNESREGSRIWKTVRFLLGVVCVLLLWRGTEIVRAYTASLRKFEVDPSQCRAFDSPPWLTRADLRTIHAATKLIEGPRLSLYTPDLVSRFASAYEASPWVKRVVAARGGFPNRVRVRLELRKPLIGVRGPKGETLLVDEEGLRLPGVRAEAPSGLGRPFRYLDGVSAAVPAAGKSWSAAVDHGVAVATELLTMPDELARETEITSIDVTNVDGRANAWKAEILLRTRSGVVIEWGRSSISPRGSLDPKTEEKLAMLRRALHHYPGLAGLSRVKLQFDDLVVVELHDEYDQ